MSAETIALIDTSARNYIEKKRDPHKVYPGHDISHLASVARLTELAGLAAGYPDRIIEISRVAGWFHDFERSPNETNRISDERLSADTSTRFLADLDRAGVYKTTLDEQAAVRYAILNAGRPPIVFTTKPDPKQWTLADQVLVALFVADKMEANGVWVIARGSQVIAGSRLHEPDADLPKYGLQPYRDENKAVLLERAVRIAFINPEGMYPPVFRPLTSQMYGPQRDFIHGLLAAEGIDLDGYAKLLLETRMATAGTEPQPNYLQQRQLGDFNRAQLVERLHQVGGLSNEGIQQAEGDLAYSAAEAVTYFGNSYRQPLEELVRDWQPQYGCSRLWQRDMLDYMSGVWFDNMKARVINQRST